MLLLEMEDEGVNNALIKGEIEEPSRRGWASRLLEMMSDCQQKARHPEEGGEWR